MNPKPEHFTKLMARYKLSHPVSTDDQRYILARRRTSLNKLLKEKGSYSLIIGIIYAINAFFRNIGIHLTLLQTNIIAGLVAAAVSTASVAGTYQVARYILKKFDRSGQAPAQQSDMPALREASEPATRTEPSPDETKKEIVQQPAAPDLKTDEDIKKYYHKLEVMHLDDGSLLVGAVIYQDSTTIKIHTAHGVIQLPVKSVKNIQLR